ncbi:Vps9 domain protein [Lasiodiplodia theobromae]|uniref:Vps9 domain protein n=1 Tax=Lasiodiplodia theobromae TaxID=45133 RepID=UPI0015C30A7B|nr:Vps9 domain protein [Lasiodiplodia theobromae]KAF4546728.1 Vps9 domain protein [Lasiodiplodia theobromae]
MSQDEERPRVIHASKSFSRFDSAPQGPRHRSRASTVGASIPEILHPTAFAHQDSDQSETGDVFATRSEDGDARDDDADGDIALPESFEDLPIEIRSLAERFIESLSARVHPSPIGIDSLSDLFQEFYVRAASQIDTHIAALSTRLSRQGSTTSLASRTSTGSRNARKTSESGQEQQMLTVSEISDRKKARRLLELKRTALEEAVERAVCEKLSKDQIYSRIWRHRSTDDGERDEKLRSRTAALSLVGIGLKELLGHGEEITPDMRKSMEEKKEEIPEMLAEARESIQRMNDEKYPLGKLQHLTAAHKHIVEALSHIFPSSSSADEILPTLIYALITSPPDSICVISNLHFIQRFRTASKLDGESAYCLVNLEASISFLENVDLSTLRADELPGGPDKSSRPITPSGAAPMDLGITPAKSSLAPDGEDGKNDLPSPLDKSQRRLSNLIQQQTNRIEAASDAARQAVLDSADQAFESINQTLDNSLKFLFGRLKEQQAGGKSEVVQPKTLEDVRKLVSTPPPIDDNASGSSSINEEATESTRDSKVTDLFGGRRPLRERSVDSAKSGASSRRVAFTPADKGTDPLTSPPPQASTPTSAGVSAVESMRNLGSSLNPLRGFGGMNMLPKFGRANTSPSAPTTPTLPAEKAKPEPSKPAPTSSPSPGPEANPKAAAALNRLDELSKTAPPVKRFIDAKEAKDLKIGDIEELLKDYQRLASAIRTALKPQ